MRQGQWFKLGSKNQAVFKVHMQHGHLLEQIIANFNSHFFMNDFVFLNPKYFRGGSEKELCDLLLILNDDCIVISVKGTDGRHRSGSKLQNWLVKKTWEGSKQAKGGVNWLEKTSFTGRNLWNEDRKFEPNSLRAICGLTLLECSQHPFDPIEYEISRHPSIESYMPPEFMTHVEPLEKRSAYLQMAAMLNALPISNKVYLGQEIESLLKDLRHSDQAGCFAFKPLLRELVFVFACFSKLSRTDRIHNLHSMLPAALYRYNVTEGLGVAFDADNSDSGFDLMWVRDYKTFNMTDQQLGEFLFPAPEQTLVADLFGQARPYLPE